MKKYSLAVIALFSVLNFGLLSINALAATDEQSIAKVLNSFHQAAANAQAKPYFNLLSEDAIFLGTDGSERWTKEQFKGFVLPYFSKGNGWLYTPTERNITIVQAGQVAFFDELLINEGYGICRGSGVLTKTDLGWKISQYNLSIPMPNGLTAALVKQIKSYEKSKD